MSFKEGKIIEKFFVNKDGKKTEVIFRYIGKNDAKDLLKYINSLVDEKAFIGSLKKKTLKHEKEFVAKTIDACKKRKGIALITEINGEAVSLAEIKSKTMDSNKHTAEIGIGLRKDYRRLGIATRILKTLIRLAKRDLKTEVVLLTVYSGNKPAQKLYKKVGFVKTGVIPKGAKVAGRYYDEIIMVLK